MSTTETTLTPLETTGEKARIAHVIIAGQPRSVALVDVIAVDGPTLTYTTDGVWRQTITRNGRGDDWGIVREPFTVSCGYCGGEHIATEGTYFDGAPAYGSAVYGVTDCKVAPTPYGVLEQTDRRVEPSSPTCPLHGAGCEAWA